MSSVGLRVLGSSSADAPTEKAAGDPPLILDPEPSTLNAFYQLSTHSPVRTCSTLENFNVSAPVWEAAIRAYRGISPIRKLPPP